MLLLLALHGPWFGGVAHAKAEGTVGSGVTYTAFGVGSYESATATWRGEKWGLKLGAIRNVRQLFSDEEASPQDLLKGLHAAVELPGTWIVEASRANYAVVYGNVVESQQVTLVPISDDVTADGYAMLTQDRIFLHRSFEGFDLNDIPGPPIWQGLVAFTGFAYTRFAGPAYARAEPDGVYLADPRFSLHSVGVETPVAERPIDALARCRREDADRCRSFGPNVFLRRPGFGAAMGILPSPRVHLGVGVGVHSRDFVSAVEDANEDYQDDYLQYLDPDSDDTGGQIDVQTAYIAPTLAVEYVWEPLAIEIPIRAADLSVVASAVGTVALPTRVLSDVTQQRGQALYTTQAHIGVARW